MTQPETWTVGKLLKWTTDFLRKHESESPRLDAEVLLAYARGCQRIELYTRFEEEPADEIKTRFRELVKARAAGEPVAYLVGSKEFFSLNFHVTRDVLIPRPETEHLVVAVIDLLKAPSHKTGDAPTSSESDQATSTPLAVDESRAGEGRGVETKRGEATTVRILDLGTGSGCIAISLAKHLPNAIITAVDRSPAALAVARQNAISNGVDGRIEFLESDWFSTFAGQSDRQWDIIVSNPPYISQAEYEKLSKSVKNFEPIGALVSGPEGTEDIAKLAMEAPRYLSPQGYLLVEMSPMIASKVQAILSAPPWTYCRTIKDLAQHARVAVSRNSSTS